VPYAPAKHCPAGHPAYTGSRCPRCASIGRAKADLKRPSARQRGYDSKWEKESKAFLALPGNQWCACGCGKLADMVDHRIAAKGDQKLFWSRSNWQPMARACNTRKAIQSEGGFGISLAAAERRRPAGLRPSRVPLTLVCGPSGGGKSEYVRRHATPLDLIIDLDQIKAKLSGKPLYCAGPEWTAPALDERNRLLKSLSSETRYHQAWFIVSAADQEERDWWKSQLAPASVVVIAPPIEQCLLQIQRDHRRAGRVQHFMALARDWYDKAGGASRFNEAPPDRRPQLARNSSGIGVFPA